MLSALCREPILPPFVSMVIGSLPKMGFWLEGNLIEEMVENRQISSRERIKRGNIIMLPIIKNTI